MHWLIDIALGVLLAFILYAIVRVRMKVAPKMRDRFGSVARWSVWVLTLLLMVVMANLGLIMLRQMLREWLGFHSGFMDELLFSLVSLSLGVALVARHVLANRGKKS